jgi:hypothetical protein
MLDKQSALLELAKARQNTRWPTYRAIGDYHGGVYECDFVSPYTKSAGNVNAEIMVLLQDWSSDESLSGPFDEDSAKLGYSRHIPTNQNLIQLLRDTFRLTLQDTYATNLFPFVKLQGMSASIPIGDLIRAAREFAMPQITIVNPMLVICLGKKTFNALRRACDLSPCKTLDSAIDSPFDLPSSTSRVWCQAHTGRLGRNNRNRGGVDRVSDDWQKMRNDFARRFGKRAKARTEPSSAPQVNKTSVTGHWQIQTEVRPVLRANPPVMKRPKQLSEEQKPCRVLALSRGNIIYSTPTRHSRRGLRKEIISFQRRWLQKKYRTLKSMPEVVYKLQWLEGDNWIFD